MELRLSQNQSKGMLGMGSVNFEVKAALLLTAEERQLVTHYKLEKETLISKPETFFGKPTGLTIEISVGRLLSGEAFKCKNLGQVIDYTESLQEACKNLKVWLEVARTFGGEEKYVY